MEKGKIGIREKKYLVYALLALILIPNAFAYFRSGISTFDKPMETFFGFFNIQVLRNNPVVQDGFVIMVIFLSVFAATNVSLKKVFPNDHRAAGIISFAIAASGAFLMPMQWLRATGGLLSTIVYILIFGGLSFLAVTGLNKDKDGKPSWAKNVIGFILIIFLLMIQEAFSTSVGLNPEQNLIQGTVVTWMSALLFALIFVKIFQMFSSFKSDFPEPTSGGGPPPSKFPKLSKDKIRRKKSGGKNPPPGGPPPATPPNIVAWLDAAEPQIPILEHNYQEILRQGNQLLNRKRPGVLIAIADRAPVRQLMTNESNLLQTMQRGMDVVINDPHFNQMTPADQARFTNIATAILRTELRLLLYGNEFAFRLRRNNPGGAYTPP